MKNHIFGTKVLLLLELPNKNCTMESICFRQVWWYAGILPAVGDRTKIS